MAEIHLARIAGGDRADRHLVVKRMLPHLARDASYVEMFVAEARLASLLAHPNIVAVEEVGSDAHEYFYAMEYVRGADLRHVMQELSKQRRVVPVACAVAIGIAVCAALHHAHELTDPRGRALHVVHRDVSLANVLLGYDGAIKLADFGIAQIGHRRRTEPGILKGKLGYMSPEQCTGVTLDRRSDIFSLGVVLYEITTGERLFSPALGDEEVLARIETCAITPPSELAFDYPLELAAIIMTALQRDPDARYQTARDMQRDLQALLRVHGMAGSRNEIAALVARTFPVASPRPGREPMHPLEDVETVPRAVAEVPSLPALPALASAPVVPRTLSERDVVPMIPDPAVHDAPSMPVPDLSYRRYLPAVLAISLVVVGIAITSWAAYTHVHAPSDMPELATRSTNPAITISSTRWADGVKPARREATRRTEPARRTEPPKRAHVAAVTSPRPRPAAVPPVRTSPRPAPARAAPSRPAPVRPSTQVAAVTEVEAAPTDAAPAEADVVEIEDDEPVAPPPAPKRRPGPVVVVPRAPDVGSLDAAPAIARLEVHGALPDSSLRIGVERVFPALRACYREAARARAQTPPTTIRLMFEIGEMRVATRVRATGGGPLDRLAACAKRAASQIRTRHAPDVGDVSVVVTIAFRPL